MDISKMLSDIWMGYLFLAEKGINIISIIVTLLFVNFLKENVFSNFAFYSDKWKSIINLSTGLFISFVFSFWLYFMNLNWFNIILNTVICSAVSVYSNEIIKNIRKITPAGKE